jgi:hypothetical protein
MADIIITKVHDKNCDICLHMSKHDRATFDSIPEVEYREVLLDDVIDPSNTARPITYQRRYQCIERYCLTPTYEVDLPAYSALNKKSEYRGHVQGANTIVELRVWVKSLLDTTDNSSE